VSQAGYGLETNELTGFIHLIMQKYEDGLKKFNWV